MGTFLGNTFVVGVQQGAVVESLKKSSKPPSPQVQRLRAELAKIVQLPPEPVAYVGPQIGGWTGVYSAGEGAGPWLDTAEARLLSRELGTVAIAFHIFDGDDFSLCIADRGKVVLELRSSEDGLETEHRHEEVEQGWNVLAAAVGLDRLSDRAMAIMEDPEQAPEDKLTAIASLLGIENAWVAHRRLPPREDRGEQVKGWTDFVKLYGA